MQQSRRSQAKQVRDEATKLAADRPHPQHVNNKEEYEYRDPSKGNAPSHIANFTKGLPHDSDTGLLLNPVDYQLFLRGIQSGDPVDFKNTPLGPGDPPALGGTPSTEKISPADTDRRDNWMSNQAKDVTFPANPEMEDDIQEWGARLRAWESAAGGNVFDLQGPDAQAVTMPPAPRFDSAELTAEILEVYAMAFLRDEPFENFPYAGGTVTLSQNLQNALNLLQGLDWFNPNANLNLNDAEASRIRRLDTNGNNLFRGVTPGEEIGPYISQFLLLGTQSTETRGEENPGRRATDGYIRYGVVGINNRVRTATLGKDYMTYWKNYLDVQNGANLGGTETYQEPVGGDDGHRFMATPRDLATYVHYDALYEAYLNACLWMWANGVPNDPGLPFGQQDVYDKQQPFAVFGGPHILSLVTEVATRALKAVRYQKFNIHRRLRPEALGGRLDRWINCPQYQDGVLNPLRPIAEIFESVDTKWGDEAFLIELRNRNRANTQTHFPNETPDQRSYLLPMAFAEGSPMHPAYGAGHATVAGACVTILKAFFDHGQVLPGLSDDDGNRFAYVASADGSELVRVPMDRSLTVEGELNKLCANIAIGRNWAGVHYYTDYIESIRMGEEIAIGLLQEQKLTYPENFTMTVPLFDGGAVII